MHQLFFFLLILHLLSYLLISTRGLNFISRGKLDNLVTFISISFPSSLTKQALSEIYYKTFLHLMGRWLKTFSGSAVFMIFFYIHCSIVDFFHTYQLRLLSPKHFHNLNRAFINSFSVHRFLTLFNLMTSLIMRHGVKRSIIFFSCFWS